jgi:hypothetical protein
MTCIVNPCEKPVELFRKLYRNCRNWAVPGQTILVLGHGSGPEVEAAVLERLNVIAVDKCPRQSAHLFVRLEALRIRLAVPPKTEEKEVKLSGVKWKVFIRPLLLLSELQFKRRFLAVRMEAMTNLLLVSSVSCVAWAPQPVLMKAGVLSSARVSVTALRSTTTVVLQFLTI